MLHLRSAGAPLDGDDHLVSLEDLIILLIRELADGVEELLQGDAILLEGLLHGHDAVFDGVLLRCEIDNPKKPVRQVREAYFSEKGSLGCTRVSRLSSVISVCRPWLA